MVRQTSQNMYYTNSHRTNREKASHNILLWQAGADGSN